MTPIINIKVFLSETFSHMGQNKQSKHFILPNSITGTLQVPNDYNLTKVFRDHMCSLHNICVVPPD